MNVTMISALDLRHNATTTKICRKSEVKNMHVLLNGFFKYDLVGTLEIIRENRLCKLCNQHVVESKYHLFCVVIDITILVMNIFGEFLGLH